MSSGFAVSSFLPSVVSSGIFSTRRASRGAEAMSASNPIVGIMNGDIATGQIYNAAKGVSEIAKDAKHPIFNGITSAEESIKALSKGDKFLTGMGKVVQFTADHINPIIVATGAAKVLTSDDKEEAFVKEALGLSTMFAAESLAKNGLGIPLIKNIDGKKMVVNRQALYQKSPFLNKQAAAMKDFLKTKEASHKFVKYIPSAAKGLGLVGASILGYNVGLSIAESLLGEKSSKKATC